MDLLKNILPNKSTFDGTLMLQIFNVFRQLAVIVGSILVARSTFSLDEIGTFESLLFISFVVNLFWYNGFFTAYLKVSGESNENCNSFSFSAFTTVTLIGVLLSALIYFSQDLVVIVFNLDEWEFEFNYFLGYMALQAPIFFTQGILISDNKVQRGNLYTFIFFISYISVFTSHFYFEFSLEQLLFAMMIMAIFQFIAAFIILLPSFSIFVFDQKRIRYWAKCSLPLLVYSALGSSSFVFDNWLVNWYYNDKSEYAIFRYGARELPLIQTIIISLGVGMVYKLSSDLTVGLAEIKKKSNDLLKWLVPLLCLLVISSPYLFRFIFGEEFVESAFIFNLYLILLLSRLIYSNIVIIAIGKSKWLNFGLLIEILINFILSLILIQYFGIIGIAIATVIAFFVEKIVFMAYLKIKHKIDPKDYLPSNYFILAVVIVTLATLLIFRYLN